MYGALEGMSIPGLALQVGKDAVINYNKDLYARPPPMTVDHPYWHGCENKYSDLDPKVLSITANQTLTRTCPEIIGYMTIIYLYLAVI